MGLETAWWCFPSKEPGKLWIMLDFLDCWCSGSSWAFEVQKFHSTFWAVACWLRLRFRQPWLRGRSSISCFWVHLCWVSWHQHWDCLPIYRQGWCLHSQSWHLRSQRCWWLCQYHRRWWGPTCWSYLQWWPSFRCFWSCWWLQRLQDWSLLLNCLQKLHPGCQPCRSCRWIRYWEWNSILDCQELVGHWLGRQGLLQDWERSQHVRYRCLQLISKGSCQNDPIFGAIIPPKLRFSSLISNGINTHQISVFILDNS